MIKRTAKQRLAVMGFLLLAFFSAYGVARRYSFELVAYVVEQALLQKTPEAIPPDQIRRRFETFLEADTTDQKMNKLLALSNYLEKVQKLTAAELDRLLSAGGNPGGAGLQ